MEFDEDEGPTDDERQGWRNATAGFKRTSQVPPSPPSEEDDRKQGRHDQDGHDGDEEDEDVGLGDMGVDDPETSDDEVPVIDNSDDEEEKEEDLTSDIERIVGDDRDGPESDFTAGEEDEVPEDQVKAKSKTNSKQPKTVRGQKAKMLKLKPLCEFEVAVSELRASNDDDFCGTDATKLFSNGHYDITKQGKYQLPSGKLSLRGDRCREKGTLEFLLEIHRRRLLTSDVSTAYPDGKRAGMQKKEREAFKKERLFVQRAFSQVKGEQGFWDPELLTFLAPLVRKYASYPRKGQQRARLLKKILRAIFRRSPENHPNLVGFKTAEAERLYIADILQWLHNKAHYISKTSLKVADPDRMQNTSSSKIEDALRRLMGSSKASKRAHDRWANHPDNKERLDVAWKAQYQENVRRFGEDVAKANRVADQQTFRREEFAKLGKGREEWMVPDDDNDDLFDQKDWALEGLPIVYMVLQNFSEKSGCPVLIATGGPSLLDPNAVETHT